MVRKVIVMLCMSAIVLGALCAPIVAATHSVYNEGTMSNTYVQYFKDILSGADIKDDYVAFRSSQYEYIMVVGDLEYNNGLISLTGDGTLYSFTQTGTYNSQYKYTVSNINNFSVSGGENIIYSNVGQYPHLVERGAHIETLTLILISVMCIFGLVDRIFRNC